MGLCVIEGSGGSDNLEVAKEKWTEINVAYVDKQFDLGNPAGGNTTYWGTISCSMSDVLPTNATLAFATICAANSARAGGATISSVSGKNVIVGIGYSYNNGVVITVRGYYIVSASKPFEIESATHYFYPGNVMGSSMSSKDIECSVDSVLPKDAVIIGYGFKSLGNATGGSRVNGIINRTPIINIGYSYNYPVEFTIEAFYI